MKSGLLQTLALMSIFGSNLRARERHPVLDLPPVPPIRAHRYIPPADSPEPRPKKTAAQKTRKVKRSAQRRERAKERRKR